MCNLIYINPRNNPEYRYFQVLNDINSNFSGITSGCIPISFSGGSFLSLSGGTVSGNTLFTQNLSAGTFYSGSTNLYDIFATTSSSDITRVQPGSNIQTGGTDNYPIVSTVASPSFFNLYASGSTQLKNTTVTSLSGGTVSGGTFYSGSTNLNNIFQQLGLNSVVSNGLNTYTAGTFYNQTVNVSALTINTLIVSGSSQLGTTTASSFSGGTVSGGTFISGTTNLSNIFASIGDITRVQPGTNIQTGGTGPAPIISTVASPIFTNTTISGLTEGGAVYTGINGLLKTNSGFTYNDVTNKLFAQNIQIGSAAYSGSVTIWGDMIVIGQSVSAFTSQLYVEDNNIILNFNPTASTTSSSLGAGFTIQDGSGIPNVDVFLEIMGTASTIDARSFSTNLNDIRVRESGTTSSPNGARLLAEWDILDAGFY